MSSYDDCVAHIAETASRDCRLCHGSGAWPYDRDHSQPCPRCCKHDRGFWPLTEGYAGYAAGDRFCCLGGCGYSLPFDPDRYGKPTRSEVPTVDVRKLIDTISGKW